MLVKRQSYLEIVSLAGLLYPFISDTHQILLFKVDVGCMLLKYFLVHIFYILIL